MPNTRSPRRDVSATGVRILGLLDPLLWETRVNKMIKAINYVSHDLMRPPCVRACTLNCQTRPAEPRDVPTSAILRENWKINQRLFSGFNSRLSAGRVRWFAPTRPRPFARRTLQPSPQMWRHATWMSRLSADRYSAIAAVQNANTTLPCNDWLTD